MWTYGKEKQLDAIFILKKKKMDFECFFAKVLLPVLFKIIFKRLGEIFNDTREMS